MVKILIISVGCAWLVLALFAYLFQHHLLFQPTRELGPTPAAQGLAYEDVTIASADGERLHAWFIPHPSAAATVLFLHGNAGNISDRPLTIARLHDLELSVLMLDYRGYGRSSGHPSERGTYADASAAWRYLIIERKQDPGDVIIYGRSLGGAIAIELASRTTPRAVIVESTFSSIADIADEIYPYLPTRLLLRYEYPSSETIKRLTAPVLIAHSEDDEMIPFGQGQLLLHNAPAPKRFYRLRGSHNQAFVQSGQSYYRAIEQFITAAGSPAR
jgi:uncharacterized protein